VSKQPFVVRWRNAVMDDPDLSSRAKAAAMPLVRHADLDGKNCYPGALKCAAEMSVGKTTIKLGWAELKAAGYLEIMPLPAGRRRSHGAVKVMRFPSNMGRDTALVDQHGPQQVTEPGRGAASTFPGNREGTSSPSDNGSPSGKPCRRHPEFIVDPGYTCALCDADAYYAQHGGRS
jgi:hypothetical protein